MDPRSVAFWIALAGAACSIPDPADPQGAATGGSGAAASGATGGGGNDSGGGVAGVGAGGACTMCAGSCVDLASDDQNCNVCGHDCLGGKCVAAVCQPVVLATGLAYPLDIAIDGGFVYWSEWGSLAKSYADGGVRKCSKSGCAGGPELVVKSTSQPTSVTVDATHVFVGNHSAETVGKCPLAGCAVATQLASSAGDPRGIAVSATDVYWVALNTGAIFKCAKTGCGTAPTPIASGLSAPWRIALDGSFAYAGGQTVARVPLAGGPISEYAKNQWGRGIAVNQTGVFWAKWIANQDGGIATCPLAGCGSGPTTVALEKSGKPHDLALDAERVYWSNEASGEIASCPLTGCAEKTVLATGQSSPRRIAVDEQAIYWVNAGAVDTTQGSVMKLAK